MLIKNQPDGEGMDLNFFLFPIDMERIDYRL